MFQPNKHVSCCPICGVPLQYDCINQFDVPVDYSVQCMECCDYSDIWVNGLREVQCGQWNSPDYKSDYGTMTRSEKWQEFKVLCQLNVRILWERLRYKVKFLKVSRERGKQISV